MVLHSRINQLLTSMRQLPLLGGSVISTPMTALAAEEPFNLGVIAWVSKSHVR